MVTIYTPSCPFKCSCISLYCRTQKKI